MKKLSLSKYIAIAATALLAASSCTKENSSSNAPIVFSVGDNLECSETKAVVTQDNLSSATVCAYATMGNSAMTNLSPANLSQNSTTGYWKALISGSNYVNWGSTAAAYTFRVYAYSAGTGSSVTMVNTNGTKFSVVEPTSYTSDAFADYLFSSLYTVTAAESAAHPLIDVALDHVLPQVLVYIVKDESMKDVNVTSISLSGFYSAGTLEYSTSESVWTTEFSGSISDATYTTTGTFAATTERSTTAAKMSIITMPQQLTQNTKLDVTYEVDESPTDGETLMHTYTKEFILADYGKTDILAGHRAVFFLDIDTGIHLSATIVPWKQVDFIEGTVLPKI